MASISHIYLNDDEVLKKEKIKLDSKPNFYMVGNGTMNKHKIQSIDLLDELMLMTKAEQFVVKLIKDAITYDNPDGEVYISMSSLTKTQVTVFKKGFKALNAKDLVRRTKRSHYMINPNALVPINYTKSIELWKSTTNA